MIDIGVASPKAHGHAMMRTLTAATRAEGEPGLGTVNRPDGECGDRDQDDSRHEPARDLIGQALDRRAGALRLRDHLYDLGQHGVAADLFRAHDEAAGAIERAGDYLAAHFLADRHGFAGHHRFVQRRSAFDNLAVHRHLLARPDAEPVADLQSRDLDFFVGAVRPNAARGLWREVEQRLDRARGRLARPQFEHLTEQNENGDHCGRFKVDGDGTVVASEGGWKDAR
jgi:hypothetical protein